MRARARACTHNMNRNPANSAYNKPREFSQLEHLSPCSHHYFCIEQSRKVQIESTDIN